VQILKPLYTLVDCVWGGVGELPIVLMYCLKKGFEGNWERKQGAVWYNGGKWRIKLHPLLSRATEIIRRLEGDHDICFWIGVEDDLTKVIDFYHCARIWRYWLTFDKQWVHIRFGILLRPHLIDGGADLRGKFRNARPWKYLPPRRFIRI